MRMRQGDSDRAIAKARLMGRRKAGELRRARGAVPAGNSSVEAFREQVLAWREAGIRGTTIHKALVRNHGYSGSYSAVRRFLQALDTRAPTATVILEFAPGEAAQVDFGASPMPACD